MDDMMNFIQQQLMSNFDIGFTLATNFATYAIIVAWACIDSDVKKKMWMKRAVLVVVIMMLIVVYKTCGYDDNLRLVNSAILSPVAWSWIFKPLCDKLGIDYKNVI